MTRINHSTVRSIVFLTVVGIAAWSGKLKADVEFSTGQSCQVRVETPGSYVEECEDAFQNTGCFINWEKPGCEDQQASAEGLFAHPHNCRIVGDNTVSDWFDCTNWVR